MKAKVNVTITFEYEANSEHYDDPEDFDEFKQRILEYDDEASVVELLYSDKEFDLELDIIKKDD